MNLEIIRTQTTWNDAAGSINSNYAKIADAIAQLKANGGGGGGGADIDLTDYATKVWVEAKGYITASALTPYALKTDIPSLVGYATEDFVNNKLNAYTTTEDLAENYASKNDLETAINNIDLSPYLKAEDAQDTYATQDYVTTKLVDYAPLTSVQGFENRIGGLEGAVPQLNERVTTVEGKVSSLNEIVSTGENNLLDRVNTIETDYVTSGDLESAINGIDISAYLLKADLTKSRIQSTLGISDWALAAIKPSYTAAEVGALSLDGTSKMQQSKNIEWSNTEGYEDIDVFSNGLRLLGYNASKGNYGGGIHIGTRYGWQLMTKWGENPLYYRSYDINSQIWRDWETLAFVSDIPTKLSQLTDDVVVGKYLPMESRSEINPNEMLGSGTARIYPYIQIFTEDNVGTYRKGLLRLSGSGSESQLLFDHAKGAMFYRQIGNIITHEGWREVAFTDSNVASATKLQTPRSIWGQSFDGTADVNGNLYSDIWRVIKDSTWNGTFIQSANYNGTSDLGNIYMSAIGGNRLTSFNVWANDSKFSNNVTVAGNVGIGNTSPTERLDVSGNIKASGNINATSITINGVTITASNGSITVNGNVFATGDITGFV